MKKIKVCISNYGTHQLWCLKRVINELSSFTNYNVDISVYTNVETGYNQKKFNDDIGYNLPFTCRQDMVNNLENYDLFLYNENDNLITEDNVQAWEQAKSGVNIPDTVGFYRYELIDGKKIFIDINRCFGDVGIKKEDNRIFALNKHQGCFLLTREELKFCIDSGEFLQQTGRGPYGILEQGASDPYTKCGLNKFFPLDRALFERLGIIHLPNKYYKMGDWVKGTVNTDDFFID